MALRVLLADESATIKRVMQLALQDFAVEVKSVPIGIDVVQVAQNFKPDIIFADILLSKRNGYDVCADIKADSVLKSTPVVLMWSGFMEFDETKFRQVQGDQKIEKPFDADTLRNIVKNLVKKTENNVISQFLTFPDMPTMIEEESKVDPQLEKTSVVSARGQTPDYDRTQVISSEPMQPIDDPDEFQPVKLTGNKARPQESLQTTAQENRREKAQDPWQSKKIDELKINLPPDDFGIPYEEYSATPEELGKSSIAFSSGNEEVMLDDIDEPMTTSSIARAANNAAQQKTFSALTQPQKAYQQTHQQLSGSDASLNQEAIESLIRQEAQKMVEDIAWKVIPDIAERVIREEIQRLLRDAEKLS